MKQPHRISFRRTSWVLAIAFCLSALLATAAAASDLWASEPDVQTYRGYALDGKSEELVARIGRYEQLTEAQQQLNTFYLARLVTKSVYLFDYWLRSFSEDTVATREAFYNRVKSKFNGLRELESRADAANALMAAYEYYSEMSYEELKEAQALSAVENCELLLSIPVYSERLEEADHIRVSKPFGLQPYIPSDVKSQ